MNYNTDKYNNVEINALLATCKPCTCKSNLNCSVNHCSTDKKSNSI